MKRTIQVLAILGVSAVGITSLSAGPKIQQHHPIADQVHERAAKERVLRDQRVQMYRSQGVEVYTYDQNGQRVPTVALMMEDNNRRDRIHTHQFFRRHQRGN